MIGGAELTIQCAERWISRGHQVAAVVGRGPAVAKWAFDRGLRCFPDVDSFVRMACEIGRFDVLFSVINDSVLDANVLDLPDILAINYHNAPLPRYAGVFATSWALLNGETTHGMTWHMMTGRIDAGAVLASASFDIAPDDTAATLNRRCQSLALERFDTIIDDLESGRFTRQPQDASQRTYYPLHRKPPGGGLIRWDRPAAEIDRTVRALTRGSIVNSFELPKIAWRERFLIPGDLRIAGSSSGATPGTILACDEMGLRVATGTDDIVITHLLTHDGVPVDLAWVAASIDAWRVDLRRSTVDVSAFGYRDAMDDSSMPAGGERLPVASVATAVRLESIACELATHEGFCVTAWKESVPTFVRTIKRVRSAANGNADICNGNRQSNNAVAGRERSLPRQSGTGQPFTWLHATRSRPAGLKVRLPVHGVNLRRHDLTELLPDGWTSEALVLLDALLAQLRPHAGQRTGSVLLRTPGMRERARGLDAFIASALPVTVPLPWTCGDSRRLASLARTVRRIDAWGAHGHDLPMRHKIAPVAPMQAVFDVLDDDARYAIAPWPIDRVAAGAVTLSIGPRARWFVLSRAHDIHAGAQSRAMLRRLADRMIDSAECPTGARRAHGRFGTRSRGTPSRNDDP
ncbi:hypothetical protein IQ289_24685 [Burkholderia sp. R-70006]|uniref:formyltransferase family protein n=1 Tax=Paraburkholderia domus TaxID=2793075 RepID=UPI001911AE49|nr:formyltransferase family protein [Paraburkholderia domus]MBK5051586.1 hypothetical protein [Burkholderia sp. R-70006]